MTTVQQNIDEFTSHYNNRSDRAHIDQWLPLLEAAYAAGDNDNGDAAYYLSIFSKDFHDQETWLNAAVAKGNGDAAYTLASIYYYRTDRSRHIERINSLIGLIYDKKVRQPKLRENLRWQEWYADKAFVLDGGGFVITSK